jgi:hypothetical protein
MFGQTDVPHNPFVYMRENKFYYQGEEFLLKTCNYLVSSYLDDNNSLVVCPAVKYFNSDWEENPQTAIPSNQVDATNQIRAHFKVIKEMGFNSVRIMNCQVRTRWDSDVLTTRLFFKNWETENNPDPEREKGSYGTRNYEILTDLEGENGKEYFIQTMNVILEAAEEFDLKVIWVLGGEWDYVDAEGETHCRSLLTSQNTPIYNQFIDFVEYVAQQFKSNTALIGYDLFNELKTFNQTDEGFDSYDLSNAVKGIVTAIKTEDINHFITVGLTSINSFYTLGVKPFYHTDVISFHLYEGEYEHHDIPLGGEINRQLKYFSSLEHPWMIGETGYSTYNEEDDDNNQRSYIATTGLQNYNCNSLGYSWWELYDMDYGNKRLGLLKRTPSGEIVNLESGSVKIYGNYKYSVDPSFTKDLNQSIFHAIDNSTGSCYFPNDYFYNFFPVMSNSPDLKTWDGLVVDQGNNAVANAIVKISVLYDDPSSDDPEDLKLYDFFTFTNESGHFSLSIPTTDNIASIRVTKFGYNITTRSTVWHTQFNLNNDAYVLTNQYLPAQLQPTYSIFVNSGETKLLNQPTMITGNIYVYNGGTLRINSTICFDDNSQLKVYPGGKVVLEDGAVLTAKHEHWFGIVMMNFNNLTNIPESYLSSSGNTIIANAFQGISSHYDNYIYLNGTKFINNYQDVYINNNHAETVVFRNCDFILNEEALEQYSVSNSCDNHVRIYTSDKVTFTNCHFDDQRTYGNPPNKVGIYAYNLEVLQVLPDPLITTRRSSFTNLQYGIYAFSANGDGIVVKNCDFNTVRGIYLYNYMGFFPNTITNNNFIIKNYVFPITTDKTGENPGDDEPEDEFYYRSYGIYIDMFADRYQIEGNSFTSETGFATNKYGIVSNNNGSFSKRFYRNNFSSLENAVQSINQNRSTSSSSFEGLQVICNNFNNTKTDIYVTSEVNVPNWGVAAYQGSFSSPAANLFSTNTPSDCFAINNEQANITYFVRLSSDPYYNSRELLLSISDNVYMYAKHFGIPNACPDGTNKLPKPLDKDLLRAEMSTAKSLENAITTMLNDIVDGGNTGQTISAVLNSEDNTAWLTYFELINKSPYLSDTVLKEVSKKEQGLTAPMIRDILVANPQGIKNKDLQQMLMDRNNPLPDYMIEQIKSGQGIISAKENLEIQRAEQQRIYEECLITLVDFYMSAVDSLPYAMDSIEYLLREKKEAKYMYVLADYYFERGDFATAQTVLDKIVVDCVLTENELGQNRDLYSFYSLYDYLMRYYKNDLSELNETHIAQLRQFELKGGFAGTKAKVLLMLNSATDYREAVYTPVAPIENRSLKSGHVNNSNPYFSVYPNPAKEYFYFEYSVPEAIGTMQVVVSDISGKILLQKQISELRDIVIIKTVDLPSGTYNCTFYNGNKSVYNGKIIVD